MCGLHNQPCHVVYTDYRPVPLKHFIYPCGADGLYEVVDISGKFNENQFSRAMAHLQDSGAAPFDQKRRAPTKGTIVEKRQLEMWHLFAISYCFAFLGDSNIFKIVRTINEKGLMPMICFTFSRKECEGLAIGLKDMDFSDGIHFIYFLVSQVNTEVTHFKAFHTFLVNEKKMIREIFDNAMDQLRVEDRTLPQVSYECNLCRSFIVHRYAADFCMLPDN